MCQSVSGATKHKPRGPRRGVSGGGLEHTCTCSWAWPMRGPGLGPGWRASPRAACVTGEPGRTRRRPHTWQWRDPLCPCEEQGNRHSSRGRRSSSTGGGAAPAVYSEVALLRCLHCGAERVSSQCQGYSKDPGRTRGSVCLPPR